MILLAKFWAWLTSALAGASEPGARDAIVRPGRYSIHEQIIFTTRRHAIVAIWPMWEPLLGGIVVAWVNSKTAGSGPLDKILLVGEALLVVRWLWRVWGWQRETFTLTSRRVVLVYGILTECQAMMPTSKVTDLTYVRSPLGDLLGYGHVIIESAGQEQALHEIKFLPHPSDVFGRMDAVLFGVDQPTPSID